MSDVTTVILSVPQGFRLPSGLKIADFAGLESVRVLRSDGADLLAAEFADSESARVRWAELSKALGTTATPTFYALAAERKPKSTVWPSTMFAKVERVVAILGIILALVNYGDVFFGAPDVTIRSPEAFDVQRGEAGRFTIRLFNRTDARVTVDLDSDQRVTIDPPVLGLDGRADADVTVVADPVDTSTDIALRVKVTGGYLRFRRHDTRTIRLNAWSSFRTASLDLNRVYSSNKAADVTLRLEIGEEAPAGLSCGATLVRTPGVLVVGARPSTGFGSPQSNAEPGNEAAHLSWTMPPASSFSTLDVSLFLTADRALSDTDWRAMLRQLEVTCGRR